MAAGVVTVGRIAAGVGLVAQLELHWLERGNGSTFTGARLGSTLLHHELIGGWGRAVGVFVFALAFLGVGCLAVAPVRSQIADWFVLAAGSVVVGGVTAAWAAGGPPLAAWGPGMSVVTAAGAVAVAVSVVGLLAHRTNRIPGTKGRS